MERYGLEVRGEERGSVLFSGVDHSVCLSVFKMMSYMYIHCTSFPN